MECDEAIKQLLKDEPEPMVDNSLDKHRERLTALVAGGKYSQYLGENYTIEKIDNMTKKLQNCTHVMSLDWELP